MVNSDEQFDGLFINVLQNAKGIDNFFDHMFSFFRRKTDLYTNPEGSLEKIHEKFEIHKKKFLADKEREAKRKAKEEQLKKEDLRRLTPTVKEITPEEAEKLKQQERQQEEKKVDKIVENVTSPSNVQPKVSQTENKKPKEEKTDSDKQLPNRGNGGFTDKFTWTQILEEIKIELPVDSKYKGKDFNITYNAKSLNISLKNGDKIVGGDLTGLMKPDTFVWVLETSSLNENKVINITFEKYDAMKWWDSIFKGDPIIDTSKINPEPSKLSDLDPEMRSSVDKMMFDQRQKELGLPVSDDLDKHEKLQKFMREHPEMDFSKAKFG